MISLSNGVRAPSEGRGHRFESCRVRRIFNDLVKRFSFRKE